MLELSLERCDDANAKIANQQVFAGFALERTQTF